MLFYSCLHYMARTSDNRPTRHHEKLQKRLKIEVKRKVKLWSAVRRAYNAARVNQCTSLNGILSLAAV